MPPLRWLEHIRGRTIVDVKYMARDTAGNTNGLNETIEITLDDGSVFSVWAYGYALDCRLTPDNLPR